MSHLAVKPKNYLFDFDGTLVDSSRLHEDAFLQVISHEIPKVYDSFNYEKMKGLTTKEVFQKLGIEDLNKLNRCVEQKQKNYRDYVRDGRLKLIGDAREILELVISRGKKNYLVTSGSARSVLTACEILKLSHLFKGVITSDDVQHSKPNPDPYLSCLNRYHLDKKDCVAIEDATSGCLSAKAAGLIVVGVNNRNIESLADVFFSSIDDMVEII